jgi:flavin-dependent dehydrogenase
MTPAGLAAAILAGILGLSVLVLGTSTLLEEQAHDKELLAIYCASIFAPSQTAAEGIVAPGRDTLLTKYLVATSCWEGI